MREISIQEIIQVVQSMRHDEEKRIRWDTFAFSASHLELRRILTDCHNGVAFRLSVAGNHPGPWQAGTVHSLADFLREH